MLASDWSEVTMLASDWLMEPSVVISPCLLSDPPQHMSITRVWCEQICISLVSTFQIVRAAHYHHLTFQT